MSSLPQLDPHLKVLAHQLASPDVRARKLALNELREMPAEKSVPLIQTALKDHNQQVRSLAVFSLGVNPTPDCLGILIEVLQTDPDYGVRADAAGALGYLGNVRALESLVRAFYEETAWLVRFSAVVALGNLRDRRAETVLLQALNCQEVVMHQAAIAALGEISALNAIDPLLSFLDAEDWLVRQRLAEALGYLPSEKSLSALQVLQSDRNFNVAEAANLSLQRLQELKLGSL
ncbi:MAG: HEAT repeat domain-containing protein [Synechococcales bacterium]|nr:HEAT repeat domain-containing protein [Synechococcales bacterium]